MTISEGSGSQRVAQPPVMDYEGSHYETDFWVGQGRAYEDATERLALRRLIPAKGRRIAEIGAAFGRLVELYQGYEQIILLDYSRSQLQTAAQRLGDDPRYVFVAGNIYNLPLASNVLDTLVMVRVMHHLAEVPNALSELQRIVHRQSTSVLEYANKRNMKSLLRWWTGRQTWSSHNLEPVEFVKLNFDFHPTWMTQQFAKAGFTVQEQLGVSHLRIGMLKRLVSANLLASIDSLLFSVGGNYPVAPSVFIKAGSPNVPEMSAKTIQLEDVAALLRCTICTAESLEQLQDDILLCKECKTKFAKKLGVWDFKEPI